MDISLRSIIGGYMIYLMCIGFLIFVALYCFDRETIRIDKVGVGKFLWFMGTVTIVRLVLISISVSLGASPFDINSGANQLDFWNLSLVFWEDCIFAIPLYYMKDRWNWSKYIYIPLFMMSSVVFALGHIYQGEWVFFPMLLVPYLAFYKNGKKWGFGTVMVCHILFDMITYATLKLAPLMLM